MFEFLGNLWDTIVDSTSSINWGEVTTDALTTSLAGAAVGGLASAISDGDIGEGLLYGAAGGLVSGGLMNFGSQFVDNWNWAGSQSTNIAGVSLMEDAEIVRQAGLPDFEFDMEFGDGASINTSGASEAVASAVGSTPSAGETQNWMEMMKGYGMGESKGWMEVVAPSLITTGGSMLAGMFAEDPADQWKEQFDHQRAARLEDQKRATGALASVYTPRGASVIDKSQPMQEEFSEIKEVVTV